MDPTPHGTLRSFCNNRAKLLCTALAFGDPQQKIAVMLSQNRITEPEDG